jgi:hypothetical protein
LGYRSGESPSTLRSILNTIGKSARISLALHQSLTRLAPGDRRRLDRLPASLTNRGLPDE